MRVPSYHTLASTLTGRSGVTIALLFGGLLAYLGCYRALTSPVQDFANYYTSSRLVLDGSFKKVNVYDYYTFEKTVDNYFRNTLSSFIPFPPSTALMFIPLAWLPPDSARALFLLINVACAALLVWMLYRLTRLPVLLLICLVLLNGISLWSDLREGQVYLLLTLLIVAALVLERKGRRFSAGALFGLALPVKYLTGLFIAYFLARKRVKLVIGAVVAAIGVFAAGLVAGGTKMNDYYLSVILPQHLAGNIQNPFAVNFQSFNSLFNRIFIPNQSMNPHPILDAPMIGYWLRALVPLIALALVLISLSKTRRAPEHLRTMYSAGLLVIFGFVVSPASANYHLTLLIIPMAILFSIAAEPDLPRELIHLRKRIPSIFGLYLAINLIPYYKLYAFESDPALQLASYFRLVLITALFLIAIPPIALRDTGLKGLVGGAIAVSLILGYVRLPKRMAGDDAKWAGVPGLIIPRLYSDGQAISYLSDTPRGYVEKRLRLRTDSIERKNAGVKRHFELSAFDSTADDSTQLFVRNDLTGATSQLTRHGLHNMDPVWNADHTRLYFLSDRGRGIDCTSIFYFPAERVHMP